MNGRLLGRQTWEFASRPVIASLAAVVGPMEGQGPLAPYFDRIADDVLLGQKTWEQAEVQLLDEAVQVAVTKAGLALDAVDVLLAGDLLNQCCASNFAARSLDLPFLGLFGACSTWAESLMLGALLIDSGFARRVAAAVSSHHNTAERQFRFPVELAHQRPLTSTWTATGAGCAVLVSAGEAPHVTRLRVTHASMGRVVDLGIKDPYDMGSAMAPAAATTIAAHFADSGRRPDDYDLIATGDLGRVGLPIAKELLARQGYEVAGRMTDCGILLYDAAQGVYGGGSGCACSAVTLCGYLSAEMLAGNLNRLLLVSTGALYSPTTYQQGESIPCVAHAVALEVE